METYSFDLVRIFFGEVPLLFFVEIVLRTTILYLYTLFIIRTLGKRSAGELTAVDVVLIVALGSAVGDPMFYQDVPVLHGILVITLVVGLQRLGLYWANHNATVDEFLKGRPSLVVSDGIFQLDGLESSALSKREVFQMARQYGYRNLGEIQRMYIETDDRPSIFGFKPAQVRPGLQFEPPWEMEGDGIIRTGDVIGNAALAACINCGNTSRFKKGSRVTPCPRCHQTIWKIIN